jgi:2,5-dihydroxypyridine 5,6-dioxygenase
VPADVSLVELFRAELELCKLKPGETLAVLSDQDRRASTFLGDYAVAVQHAAQDLGADTFELVIAKNKGGVGRTGFGQSALGSVVGATPLRGVRAAVEALKGCEMVIDLMMLLHSSELLEILDSGTRMLMVQEPPDVLKRMFPTPKLRAQVEQAAAKLEAARELRVTSKQGTDITFGLGQYPRLTVEYGYTDEPGRWDHFTAGMVAGYANDRSVNGRVVFASGDVLFPFKRYVETPIEVRVENDYITSIDGGMEAVLLRQYLDSWQDPEAYAVAHIGWGLCEAALWASLATMDPRQVLGMEQRCFAGCVMFSTGPNVDGGGSRHTSAHCDMPMLGCTLTLDGEPVVVDGALL